MDYILITIQVERDQIRVYVLGIDGWEPVSMCTHLDEIIIYHTVGEAVEASNGGKDGTPVPLEYLDKIVEPPP